MRIALAQINPTVGDLYGNSHKIVDFAREAAKRGADLVVFPEMCVIGYPPLDLLENRTLIRAVSSTVDWIARNVPGNMGVIVGAPVPNDDPVGRRLFNAAILLEGGKQVAVVKKSLLPTYDVFDEHRYFEPASVRQVVEWRGKRLGLHICEDMWKNEEAEEGNLYVENPIDELAAQGVDFFINVSASPFSIGKHEKRAAIIRRICEKHAVPFVFVNQVGANTEIIFDGDSRVYRADGSTIVFAPPFEEALMVWDTESDLEPVTVQRSEIEDLHAALVLGIRDYLEKTSFKKVLVGLSGGIDSAVTCALAVQAVGPDRVVGVTMPSKISSKGSVDDSRALAEALGIEFHEIPIHTAVEAFGAMLESVFAGTEPDVTEENIQARVRGVTLMALSNKFGYLLLTTGNKSEMAVGYATLYGDMNGGLAVLSDVFKTRVYKLAEYINQRAGREVIPQSTILKPHSAELSPGQFDQDSLPPYPVLDAVLRLYIEAYHEVDDIVRQTGIDRTIVLDILRRVDRNEYKRRQAPPGLRVSGKAFGIGRRLPIVMKWDREAVLDIADRGNAALKG